jgi:MarR family 2-MHQ and catechol resistance regulon transcriptional repressor
MPVWVPADDAPSGSDPRIHFDMSKGDKKRRRALEAYGTLQRAAAMAASHVEQAVHTFGLSASQFGVLETLHDRGPVHQQELAEALGRSKAQMTAIIDALEARALVRRERHAVDRRFISVYLTDAGRVLLAEAAPVRTDAVVALMRELSGEQRTRLTRLCRRLLRVVDPTAEDGSDEDADDAEPQGIRVEEVREEGAGDAAADAHSHDSADADTAHTDASKP